MDLIQSKRHIDESSHALQDYFMQIRLVELQKKKRLMAARDYYFNEKLQDYQMQLKLLEG